MFESISEHTIDLDLQNINETKPQIYQIKSRIKRNCQQIFGTTVSSTKPDISNHNE